MPETAAPRRGSLDAIHHQGQTSGQESAAKNGGSEGEIRTGTSARMRAVEQIAHAALHHQDRQGEEHADAEPPREGSHRCPRPRRPIRSKAAPVGHSSRGVPGCQADCLFARATCQGTGVCREGSSDDAAVFATDPDLSPRWRKIETVPSPLSAVTSPGSSTPLVVTRYKATAKGPAFVR